MIWKPMYIFLVHWYDLVLTHEAAIRWAYIMAPLNQSILSVIVAALVGAAGAVLCYGGLWLLIEIWCRAEKECVTFLSESDFFD